MTGLGRKQSSQLATSIHESMTYRRSSRRAPAISSHSCFKVYEAQAYARGFLMVSATPLTRSSYHAGEDFARLRAARAVQLAGT